MRSLASVLAVATLSLAALPWATLAAQDANILLPVGVIESRMRDLPLQVLSAQGSRMPEDRTQRVVLEYADTDGGPMMVKWAKAPRNGGTFNNEPRYEIAAYEVQKLFLDEPEYVVPPTVGRAVPRDWLRQHDPDASETFSGVGSVVMVLQYWLFRVTPDDFWDPARFEADPDYARHLANFNLLTYLIRHNDSNVGNFLRSDAEGSPRVFAVDNGVAFRSRESNRGYEWRDLRVDRLPRTTVERLRALTDDDLQRALGVLLHFEVRDGELVAAEPTENLNPGRGVRRSDDVVQFGLTRAEIGDVADRLRSLLARVDAGRIELF